MIREREPQLVTLVGVPGIGKSRLVYELFQTIETGDYGLVYWRHGRSLPYGEGVTFWALGEMVKARLGSSSPTVPSRRRRSSVRPSSGSSATAPTPPGSSAAASTCRPRGDEEAGDRRDEAFAAWRRYLEAIADERPLVLVFEDLHWADDALLDFVDYLVDWASGVPLLVLCTARPELLTRRPAWGGGKVNSSTILLSPLSDDETAKLLHALLGRSAVDAELQARLLEHAGGNPLYAEEFTRMLTSRPDEIVLPETVQGIIAARLDTLPAEEKELLQDAAVIGRVFWLGALGRERWTLEERLHSLASKEFVTPESAELGRGRGRIRIPSRARPRRRLRADPAAGAGGQAPHRSGVDRIARPAGGPRRDARPPLRVRHRVRARDRAERRPARPPRQERIAGRGRPRTRPQCVPGRRALLRARGRALAARRPRVARDPARSSLVRTTSSPTNVRKKPSRRLARPPSRRSRVELAAEADALLAELWWFRGDRDACDRHLERAHALVQDLPSSPGKARVLSQVSRYRMLAGADEDAIRIGEAALAMADELGLVELQVQALVNIGTSRANMGDAAGVEDLERAVAMAVAAGSSSVARAYNNLAVSVWVLGDLRRGRRLMDEAVAHAERLGLASLLRFSRNVRYWLLAREGYWDEALPYIEEFVAACEAGEPHYHEGGMRLRRAVIRLARDDVQGALDDVRKIVPLARSAGDPQQRVPWLAACAYLLVEAGRVEEARQLAADVLHHGGAISRSALIDLALVAEELGCVDELATIVESGARTKWTDAAGMFLRGDVVRAAEILHEIGDAELESVARLRGARRLVAEGRRAEADEQLQRSLAF